MENLPTTAIQYDLAIIATHDKKMHKTNHDRGW